MEYIISITYYKIILADLRRSNRMANHKTVIDYLNQTAGLLRKIVDVKTSV